MYTNNPYSTTKPIILEALFTPLLEAAQYGFTQGGLCKNLLLLSGGHVFAKSTVASLIALSVFHLLSFSSHGIRHA